MASSGSEVSYEHHAAVTFGVTIESEEELVYFAGQLALLASSLARVPPP